MQFIFHRHLIPVELLNVSYAVSQHNPCLLLLNLTPYMVFPFISNFPMISVEWKLMMFCQFETLYPFILATVSFYGSFTSLSLFIALSSPTFFSRVANYNLTFSVRLWFYNVNFFCVSFQIELTQIILLLMYYSFESH